MDQMRQGPDMSAMRGEMDAASQANLQQLKDELAKKQSALVKLWDSYEHQERDIAALKDRIAFLEQEMLQKDNIIMNLKMHTESKDGRLRETEMEAIALRRHKDESEPKIRSLETQLRAAEDRYAKVLKLWEASYESAKFWRKAAEDRDRWFDRHIGAFGDFKRAIDERDEMLKGHRKEAAALEIAENARKRAADSPDASKPTKR
jgi:septal ring factor EnvC (AmiA/AmiB activator)